MSYPITHFRVARSPAFDRTIQFLVLGLVDNFTQNWTGESISSGVHLTSLK